MPRWDVSCTLSFDTEEDSLDEAIGVAHELADKMETRISNRPALVLDGDYEMEKDDTIYHQAVKEEV